MVPEPDCFNPQVLNAYCDHLASGQLPTAARLTFFVRDGAAAAPASAPASQPGYCRLSQRWMQQASTISISSTACSADVGAGAEVLLHFITVCGAQHAVGNGVGAALRRVEAVLPARGSLAPLLHAFGLLSDAELRQDEAAGRGSAGE